MTGFPPESMNRRSSFLFAETDDIRTALQIITDYLTDSFSSKLCASFEMTPQDLTSPATQSLKRKADWEIALEVLNHQHL